MKGLRENVAPFSLSHRQSQKFSGSFHPKLQCRIADRQDSCRYGVQYLMTASGIKDLALVACEANSQA
jgi:hypothetical protein